MHFSFETVINNSTIASSEKVKKWILKFLANNCFIEMIYCDISRWLFGLKAD